MSALWDTVGNPSPCSVTKVQVLSKMLFSALSETGDVIYEVGFSGLFHPVGLIDMLLCRKGVLSVLTDRARAGYLALLLSKIGGKQEEWYEGTRAL